MTDTIIPIEDLHRLFSLDVETGVLYWRVRTARRTRVGDEAGALNKVTGYRHVRVNRRLVATHRVIYAMTHGAWPELSIDHINGDRVDNRPINLRQATSTQQATNKARQSNNTSGCAGVTFHRGARRWMATIQHHRRSIYLGLFHTLDDAKDFRDLAAEMLFGDFRRTAS